MFMDPHMGTSEEKHTRTRAGAVLAVLRGQGARLTMFSSIRASTCTSFHMCPELLVVPSTVSDT